MHIRELAITALVGIAAWALPLCPAAADTVLYDSSGFIQGQQSFVQSFDLTSAGTITVSLSDIPWLDTISNLSFFLTTATGTVGSPMGAGTESLDVGPGVVYAHWFGDADGSFGVGAYGIKLTFQPGGGATPVPLPGTLALLLSGLLALVGLQVRRSDDKALTIQ
jgi:hypothetical protein